MKEQTAIETYHYRVQRWHKPRLTNKWTLRDSDLRENIPSGGRGVPPTAKPVKKGNRTTWAWTDRFGIQLKVVAIKLDEPITKEVKYFAVYF